MANNQTRLNLRDRARQMTDRVGSTFVTDSEINTWIDVEGSELHDILVTKFEAYVASTATVALVAGTATYALPTDFYKLTFVDLVDGTRTYTLGRYMNRERNRRQQSVSRLGALQYSILGQQIKFIPTPTQAGTVSLGYVPQYVPLAADGTVVHPSIPQGWEEYIVAGTAIRILNKDESDPSAIMAIKAGLLQRIEMAAEDRDINEPTRMVDVTGRTNRGMSLDDDTTEGVF